MRRWIVFTRMGSSPVVGSSKNTMDGSVTSARAIATRLRIPPETSAGYLSPTSSSPTRVRAVATRATISCRDRRVFSRSGKATFPAQVSESKRAPPWNTTP